MNFKIVEKVLDEGGVNLWIKKEFDLSRDIDPFLTGFSTAYRQN